MNAITASASFPTFFVQISPIDGKGRRKKPFIQRFIENLRIGAANECWECKLSPDTGSMGYCRIRRDNSMPYAHRIAYELSHGPIPTGMLVMHRCDNPRCCNPNHLRLGTDNDNMADKAQKGRGRGRLTVAQVVEVDKLLRADVPHAKISRKFGISELSVRNIAWGVTWSKVTGRERPSDRIKNKAIREASMVHAAAGMQGVAA